MGKRVEQKPDVRRDLFEQAEYISQKNLDAALRFLEAAEATFGFLAVNCEVGQLCDFADARLAGMRVWRVEGFRNHLVYFRPTNDGVEIMRVLHGARDIETLFGSI